MHIRMILRQGGCCQVAVVGRGLVKKCVNQITRHARLRDPLSTPISADGEGHDGGHRAAITSYPAGNMAAQRRFARPSHRRVCTTPPSRARRRLTARGRRSFDAGLPERCDSPTPASERGSWKRLLGTWGATWVSSRSILRQWVPRPPAVTPISHAWSISGGLPSTIRQARPATPVFRRQRDAAPAWSLSARASSTTSSIRSPRVPCSAESTRTSTTFWGGSIGWCGRRYPVHRAAIKWRDELDHLTVLLVEMNERSIGQGVPAYPDRFLDDMRAALC